MFLRHEKLRQFMKVAVLQESELSLFKFDHKMIRILAHSPHLRLCNT